MFRLKPPPLRMTAGKTDSGRVRTAHRATSEDHLLTSHQVASFLAISPETLRWWRNWAHAGPPFIKFEGRKGRVRYLLTDLRRWVKARTVRIKRANSRRKG